MESLLFLAHRIPYPPNKGDKIRSWHLLRHLSARYRVHLGAFIDDENDWQHVGKLQEHCAGTRFIGLHPWRARLRSARALAGNRPLSIDYYADTRMRAWVDQVRREHGVDRVVVFSSPMAQYATGTDWQRRIIDFVDIDSDKWRQYADKKRGPSRWLYRYEADRLLRYEAEVALRFDASLFVSQAEAELFRQLVPAAEGRVGHFSNGVDTEYFSPDGDFADPYQPNVAAITFTGAMDYWPNVDAVTWFAKDILPEVRAAHSDAEFFIVGSRPTPEVRALAALPGVHVTGTVPDVRPYLAHARLAVAPLRIARGIQNKVLEAMAMARPVVVTPEALEGIDAEPGREVLLAGSREEFVQAVIRQLRHPDPRIGPRARDKVLASFAWESHLRQVDALISGAVPHLEEKETARAACC